MTGNVRFLGAWTEDNIGGWELLGIVFDLFGGENVCKFIWIAGEAYGCANGVYKQWGGGISVCF